MQGLMDVVGGNQTALSAMVGELGGNENSL
jgi:hypothetical protein